MSAAWQQIAGDQDAAGHGAVIARYSETGIDVMRIDPVRDTVGDAEAKTVGYPWWTRGATYTFSELDGAHEDFSGALSYIGMEAAELDAMGPEKRRLVVAEALLAFGANAEEGASGWAKDILPDDGVRWWREPDFEDEEAQFRSEILGECAAGCDNGIRRNVTVNCAGLPAGGPELVERCGECEVYPSDEDAAEKVAAEIGGRVVSLYCASGDMHIGVGAMPGGALRNRPRRNSPEVNQTAEVLFTVTFRHAPDRPVTVAVATVGHTLTDAALRHKVREWLQDCIGYATHEGAGADALESIGARIEDME